MPDTVETLRVLAAACSISIPPPPYLPRTASIWEITTWILPMAPEHLRRVLAQNPKLPQGVAGKDGGTRWFSFADVTILRAHFAPLSRSNRYGPKRPIQTRAPLVAMAGPSGGIGRSTALLHLAVGAVLAGFKVLVIDADPAGRLAQDLGAAQATNDVLSLIARDGALHSQLVNQNRIDRGEPPVVVDDVLSAALDTAPVGLVQPTTWPGLDVIAAKPALLQADLHLAHWQQALRRWPVTGALAMALDAGALRERYDLILCDTPRGLGPLAMAVLGSADVLLAPLPQRDGALKTLGADLHGLATAMTTVQANEHAMARALGHAAPQHRLRRIVVLPTRTGAGTLPQSGFAAKLGDALLPAGLPEIPQLVTSTAAHLYDLDYRDVGRLTYAPLRQACDDAWRGVADVLATM